MLWNRPRGNDLVFASGVEIVFAKPSPVAPKLRSPRVSQHQPCPNHILGKTYTEQGTQTLKVDRLARLQGFNFSAALCTVIEILWKCSNFVRGRSATEAPFENSWNRISRSSASGNSSRISSGS